MYRILSAVFQWYFLRNKKVVTPVTDVIVIFTVFNILMVDSFCLRWQQSSRDANVVQSMTENIRWVVVKFSTHVHGRRKMNFNFGNPFKSLKSHVLQQTLLWRWEATRIQHFLTNSCCSFTWHISVLVVLCLLGEKKWFGATLATSESEQTPVRSFAHVADAVCHVWSNRTALIRQIGNNCQ